MFCSLFIAVGSLFKQVLWIPVVAGQGLHMVRQ